MKEKKNKFKRSALHKVSIALLAVGFALSITTFLTLLVTFLLLGTVYLGGVLIFLLVVGVIYLVVGGVISILFGLFNFFALFIEAFFMALAGKSSGSFEGFWPDIDWNIISDETWKTFLICVIIGAFILLVLFIVLIASLKAIIPSFVAFITVACSKKKSGLVVGGIFALLASLVGNIKLIEFIGAVLAFIAKVKTPKKLPQKEEIKLIANK